MEKGASKVSTATLNESLRRIPIKLTYIYFDALVSDNAQNGSIDFQDVLKLVKDELSRRRGN